ncbi:type II secretion system protein E [Candidatus Desantisbacteria bacterium CG07_land_8_20_14_0_80_39_15]|uniref:Type II secretion system protein E n=1 Tax=Candidatus Desantisbacteria bacterium CG07_land_8_20_14_0_80_39_15 TaxID=1974549 RepID=A0A2M6ZFQ1_9BACT|nr:MAG: type II secretion system protein E [Candidatus Desantisbacteria bacterium CG07_land_8_20_14_0_80_39_15]
MENNLQKVESPLIFYKREESGEILGDIKSRVQEKLINRIGERKLELSGIDDKKFKEKTIRAVNEILDEIKIPDSLDRGKVLKEILDEVLGLGPLEDLLKAPDITEIMVNGKDKIYIERNGKLELSNRKFISERQVMSVIERVIAPLGRRIDESSPMVDARLPDGSRVNVIIPPLALIGPTITIRKFSQKALTVQDLINFNSLNENMAEFLHVCVKNRNSIIISGGTGSGKTTLLNVLSSFIPGDERIITIEDSAELKLAQEHIVSMESRPPNIEGRGQVTIRDLVRNSLRMRPDRIIVGEVRGGETLDMLQAMNTGHDGSLTTIHANSPRDALSRLETMILMSGVELPVKAIRDQLSSAIDLIVQQSRLSDGSRKIIDISEVTGLEGDRITMQDIFHFKQTGFDKNGKVQGSFVPTGNIPTFIDDWRSRGISISMDIFQS